MEKGEKEMSLDKFENLRERMDKALIDNLHMLGYSGAEAEKLWKGNLITTMGDISKKNKLRKEPKVEYAWECNECGSQEYTMSVSEDDVHELGCGRCGSSEWHKAKAK